MQTTNQRLIVLVGTVAALAGSMAAQTTVLTGTGNPDIDVPAVQAAVDQGGQILLKGYFSFDRPPAQWLDYVNGRMVLISKPVTISGEREKNGVMTTIEGGDIPFAVDALGSHVTIERLRFVRPKERAILVIAVSGLVIAHCEIAGVVPMSKPMAGASIASSIQVATTSTLFPPTAADRGSPEKVSGTLSILDNDIDVGGTAADNTLGIGVFSVGHSPDKEVDLTISRNNIRNTTERSLEVVQAAGRVHIERNVITTGAVVGPPAGANAPDVIHVLGSGWYVIAHNTIDSAWATGAGIRVQGNGLSAEAGAVVMDNDVNMTAPEGIVFAANSSGIEILAAAQGNVVVNNRIRGHARTALAVTAGTGSKPANNTFVMNDVTGFQSSISDVIVDAGVIGTVIVGSPTGVQDHGTGTVVIPKR